ncbi:hypothetical protein QYF36_000514 [Acer negundo]|nr:hypothetical protein QYF36_000514 [Acer negundo]
MFNDKSFAVSADLAQSRLSVANQKLTKWNQTQKSLLMNPIQCRALEIENAPSFTVGKKFQLDDVIEAQQFDRDLLNAIFKVAREMEKIEKNSSGSQILKGYLMATLFYEPSTRTRLSFESAMKRLGGEVLTTENAREFSSAAKGETLEEKLKMEKRRIWSLVVVGMVLAEQSSAATITKLDQHCFHMYCCT